MFVDALGVLELDLFPNLSKPSLTAAEVIGDRKLLSLNTKQQDADEKAIIAEQQRQKEKQKQGEPADENPVAIKVAASETSGSKGGGYAESIPPVASGSKGGGYAASNPPVASGSKETSE